MPKLVYSETLADKICARLEGGESLNAICKDEGMPSESCVRRWAAEDYKGFSAKYARARELGYLRLADELLEIADDGRNDWMERRGEEAAGWVANGEHLQRSRLRVDTRKWLLSKMLPKVYGDKVQHAGDPENPLVLTVAIDRPPNETREQWLARRQREMGLRCQVKG